MSTDECQSTRVFYQLDEFPQLKSLRDAWPQIRAELDALPHGSVVRVAGIVVTRQRPGSAGGVTFVTLEDESGNVNLVVWKKVGEAQRRPLLESRLMEAHGELQRQGRVIHVIVSRMIDRTALLGRLATRSRDFH